MHDLTQEDAAQHLHGYGLNRMANGYHEGVLAELVRRLVNPLNLLLISSATALTVLDDVRAAVLVAVIVVLNVVLGLLQEHRSSRVTEALHRMAHTMVTVKCVISDGAKASQEASIERLVLSDIVQFCVGDMALADLRPLGAKDVFVSQSALTGEAMSREEYVEPSESRSTVDSE